jgi:hypothetical protein
MYIAGPGAAVPAGTVEFLAARNHICLKRWNACHALA